MYNKEQFQKDLQNLLNQHSMENASNTPDFILAEYLINCLENFNNISNSREAWYGKKLEINAPEVDFTQLDIDTFRMNVLRPAINLLPLPKHPFAQQLNEALPIKSHELTEMKQDSLYKKEFFKNVIENKSKLLFFTLKDISRNVAMLVPCWDHDILEISLKYDLEKVLNKVPVYRTRIKTQVKKGKIK